MPAYNYTTLDDPFQVGFTTQASGINDAGQIVGSYHNSSGYHGFIYNAGTYTPFDVPLATNGTFAADINAAGQIVGTYSTTATHGFLYDPTNSMSPFTTLDFLGATTTSPTKINASGQVVGLIFNTVGSGEHGFLYSRGLFAAIDATQATTGTAVGGINASGQIVGFYHTATETKRFSFQPQPPPLTLRSSIPSQALLFQKISTMRARSSGSSMTRTIMTTDFFIAAGPTRPLTFRIALRPTPWESTTPAKSLGVIPMPAASMASC